MLAPDRYANKNDLTKALLGTPGSTAPGLFDLDPKNKRAKRADGFYGYRVSGGLSAPSFLPNPTGASATGARAPRATAPRSTGSRRSSGATAARTSSA